MQENAYLLDGRGGPKGQMSKTLMGKEVMKPMWDSGKQPESAGGRARGGGHRCLKCTPLRHIGFL